MLRSRALSVLLTLLFAAPLVGCGSSGPPKDPKEALESSSLSDLAEAYRSYSIANKRPPKNVGELGTAEAMGPNGVAAVKKGDIILLYGAPLPDTNEEPGGSPSTEVLAYRKEVPQEGGYVLLLNRTVKKMTADEFKSAPKASTSSSATDKTGK